MTKIEEYLQKEPLYKSAIWALRELGRPWEVVIEDDTIEIRFLTTKYNGTVKKFIAKVLEKEHNQIKEMAEKLIWKELEELKKQAKEELQKILE